MTNPVTFIRFKAFEAAMELGRTVTAARSLHGVLSVARQIESYLLGTDAAEQPAEGPVDEIPFTGDGEPVAVEDDKIVTTISHPVLDVPSEPPKAERKPRKAKPAKKPKAKKAKRPAATERDEAQPASQDSGNHLPEDGNRVPDNDAALPVAA